MFARPSCILRALRAALLLTLSFTVGAQAAPSVKKGIGLSDLTAGSRIEALNVAWYYTWSPRAIEGVQGAQFVPMVWGGSKIEEQLGALRRAPRPRYLLLINEPDKTEQSSMSVDEVARLWPTLAVLGDRVSSPAAANANGAWMERFDAIARQRGLQRDFMAIHVYGPPNPERFLAKIDAIHARYGLPLWITEFAVADKQATDNAPGNVTPEETLAFMRRVLPELEKRDWVQRYAWFGAGKGGKARVRNSRLFDADGKLTPLGRFYADFGTR
jgi:hypothetical protein